MIVQLILTIIIFLLTKYVAYIITSKGLPIFLDYMPYTCYKCLGFWLLLFIYINSYIIFETTYMSILGVILTILDVIAQTVDEKDNTISVKNYDLE